MPPPNRKAAELPATASPAWLVRAIAAGVFVITALVFARALGAGFIDFDDPSVLFKVDGYRGLSPDNIVWDFSMTYMGHFQPLTWASYGVDFLLWGLDPTKEVGPVGFHLTNVLLHAANAALLFLLARRLIAAGREESAPSRSTLFGAAAAALLWGLHPLRVESVAWITERRDVLSTFFLLLAALWYMRAFAVGSSGPSSPGRYWGCAFWLLLSLLSKSWGMSFFVVALILDIYPLRRLPLSPRRWFTRETARVLLQKAPFAMLGIAAALMAAYAQSSMADTAKTLDQWGLKERAVQVVFGLYFYVWKTIAPAGLGALYELPVPLRALEPRFVVAYVALACGAILLIVFRKRAPGLLAAAACYAVMIAPVLGLFQSGIQFVADRYSYVACIGWSVIVGAGVTWCLTPKAAGADLLESVAKPAPAEKLKSASRSETVKPPLRNGPLMAVLCVAVMLGLTVATWVQIGYWYSARLLFAHAIDVGWDGPTLRQYYAHQLMRDDPAAAAEQYRIGLELNPQQGMAWFEYAIVLRETDKLPESERAFQEAAKYMYEPWRAYTGLGLLYLERMDRAKDAVTVLRKAVHEVERPDRPMGTTPGGGGYPYWVLAGALYETGDFRGCREMLEIAAQYPETRPQAMKRIPEVDAAIRDYK
jgi:tetratricopeptide (TPR) repeat protein